MSLAAFGINVVMLINYGLDYGWALAWEKCSASLWRCCCCSNWCCCSCWCACNACNCAIFCSLYSFRKCCRISLWQCSAFVTIISSQSVVVTRALQLYFRDKLHCQYFLSLRTYWMPKWWPSCTSNGFPRWLNTNCNLPWNHFSPGATILFVCVDYVGEESKDWLIRCSVNGWFDLTWLQTPILKDDSLVQVDSIQFNFHSIAIVPQIVFFFTSRCNRSIHSLTLLWKNTECSISIAVLSYKLCDFE